MENEQLTSNDYWRAVILYGINTATYKIALGQSLAHFVEKGQTRVTMHELAEEFFDLYSERLKSGKPQLDSPNRQTKMETIVKLHNFGNLSRGSAIDRVELEAFNDVIPRFHTLAGQPAGVKFYEVSKGGLELTDNVFEVMGSQEKGELLEELASRWDLLEAAFEMRRENLALENDIREIYLAKGYLRTDITHLRPVLNGYQNGLCFYCGEKMGQVDVHVDHVIPRQLVLHDEVWNLVLAHGLCNELKSDYLPGFDYIKKLIFRNEHFIASNHPIKNKLIKQLGSTFKERSGYVCKVYDHAKVVIKVPWGGIKGRAPVEDKLYKAFIRTMTK